MCSDYAFSDSLNVNKTASKLQIFFSNVYCWMTTFVSYKVFTIYFDSTWSSMFLYNLVSEEYEHMLLVWTNCVVAYNKVHAKVGLVFDEVLNWTELNWRADHTKLLEFFYVWINWTCPLFLLIVGDKIRVKIWREDGSWPPASWVYSRRTKRAL